MMFHQECSLVVQWLKSAHQSRGQRFDPWSRKTPRALGQLIPFATTTEPIKPQSTCLTREATTMRSLYMTTIVASTHSNQRKPTQLRRPSTPKNKYKLKKKNVLKCNRVFCACVVFLFNCKCSKIILAYTGALFHAKAYTSLTKYQFHTIIQTSIQWEKQVTYQYYHENS